MLDIVGKRFRFFIISGILVLVSIISLATFGLKPGIEFSSGSMWTIHFTEQEVDAGELRQELAALGYDNAVVQTTGDDNFIIRTVELTSVDKGQLEENLEAAFGPVDEMSYENVDPVIARQTSRVAGIAVAVAAVGILLYVTWAFRRMPRPFHYGTCAIIALAHDALIALGVFSILGGIMDWEVNLMFITGILAVIGYSVNNTVVVFDRIRENLIREETAGFEIVVNNSLVGTFSRSMNTSLTTLLVVLALLLFIGATILNFSVVLLIGIVVGTFSSLCIAPSLLVVWEKGEWGRFIGRRRPSGERTRGR